MKTDLPAVDAQLVKMAKSVRSLVEKAYPVGCRIRFHSPPSRGEFEGTVISHGFNWSDGGIRMRVDDQHHTFRTHMVAVEDVLEVLAAAEET